MLKIRLSKRGSKNSPFYRIVVLDKKLKTTAKYVESLGYYDPRSKSVKVDKEKFTSWVSKGATPSQSLKKLITK